MNVPEYPEWEPDSNMNLWTRIHKMIVKCQKEREYVRLTIYAKPPIDNNSILLEGMSMRDAQKNLLSILAVESVL